MEIKAEVKIEAKTEEDRSLIAEVIAGFYGGFAINRDDICKPERWTQIGTGNWEYKGVNRFWFLD